MEELFSERGFGEEMRKEAANGEFKEANTHRLKRRFAEYYETQRKKWGQFKQFTFGHNPIEKFRDIPCVFTISLYQEYVVIGPVEKNEIKHPYTEVIGSVLDHIDRNLVHPYLLELLDRGDYPFYDNYIVAEVVDHRDAEIISSRVLLRGVVAGMPHTQTLLQLTKADEKEECAAIAKTHALCLDPSPLVFEALKMQDYNERKLDGVKIEGGPKKKVSIIGVIKEHRRVQEMQRREVFPGLERLGASQIYRTTKFIGGGTHYSVNAHSFSEYTEVVFRKGEVVNTAVGGFITRRKFTSLAHVDVYIDSVKRLLDVYHADLKCICDIVVPPRKTKNASPAQQKKTLEKQQRKQSMTITSPLMAGDIKRAQSASSPGGTHQSRAGGVFPFLDSSGQYTDSFHYSPKSPLKQRPYMEERISGGMGSAEGGMEGMQGLFPNLPPGKGMGVGSGYEEIRRMGLNSPSVPVGRRRVRGEGESHQGHSQNPAERTLLWRDPAKKQNADDDDFNFDYVNKKFI